MGTSKGYIAPTTPHWSQAKRAVTSYINSGDGESRAKAASKYASAMHHDIATSEQLQKQQEVFYHLLRQYRTAE